MLGKSNLKFPVKVSLGTLALYKKDAGFSKL